MLCLKWTNRFSGEEGYVGSVSYKEGHFNNTYEKSKAKKYVSVKTIETELRKLNEMGECDNNSFSIENLED